jgi:hypothetical protein
MTALFDQAPSVAYVGPTDKTRRVVTMVPSKDYVVIYRTTAKDPDLLELFENFKLTTSKIQFLRDHREQLQKHDIKVDTLIKAYSTDWDWTKAKAYDE